VAAGLGNVLIWPMGRQTLPPGHGEALPGRAS
jgi:hypothetical protein